MFNIKPLGDKIIKQFPGLLQLMAERPKLDAYIALDGHEAVGFMLLEQHRLVHLYVIPEARRAGVGTEMVNHAKYLSAELFAPVSNSNRDMQAFLIKNGFSVAGTHKLDDSEGLLFIARPIKPSPGHDAVENDYATIAQAILDSVCVVESVPVYL